MNRIFLTLGLGLLLMFVQHFALAKTFGGAEYTFLEDDSFVGAPEGSEEIIATTVFLGNYRALKNKPTALVLKGSVQSSRFDTVGILDNNIYGLSAGLFHKLDRKNSVITSLDFLSRRFDAEQLDGEVYKFKIALKQKQSSEFSMKETFAWEYGDSIQSANTYYGFSLGALANWLPVKRTAINAGISWNRKIYDVDVADVRTNQQLTFGIVQSLGKHLYLRLGFTRKRNQIIDLDREFYNTLLSAGAGVTF